MPANPTTQEMGERHEAYLAKINGGNMHRASGAVWFDPADGSNPRDDALAFAWDGKSTLGKGINVTRDMLAKITDQSMGCRPQIGLRFYDNPNLDDIAYDWVAVPGDNWEEVLNAGRMWIILTEYLLEDPKFAFLRSSSDENILTAILDVITGAGPGAHAKIGEALAEAHQALVSAGTQIAGLHKELAEARAAAAGPGIDPALVQAPPKLPWAVIRAYPEHQRGKSAGDSAGTVADYAADGTVKTYRFGEVRIQHAMDGRPQVYVDNVRIRNADVYGTLGKREARVCDDDPSIEEG